MIKAQHAIEVKEVHFLRTLSKKDDHIMSLIALVSELSSQLTTAMQRLFQDALGEHHGREDAGRDQQPAGPPPVPTPVAGQTCMCGLQPQQSPPALCAACYTSASKTVFTPSPSTPPAQGASAAAATATCTCKEQDLGQAAQDVICSSNSSQ
ncbi:hypothetical protein BC830DRAFT_1175692 [Chytriomyces sp. MP71]|nr:hypothetical protein BC830DRAFT_1175692 [Chytriomyces sp. MP71]